MSEEGQDNPAFALKDIGAFKTMKMKLDCSRAVKTGENQFGTWNMWFGFVENAKVTRGRKPNQVYEEGYTGKVIFFPNQYVNDQLEKLADGKDEVEVGITKKVEDMNGKPVYRYTIEKISEGTVPQSSLTPSEVKFVKDITTMMDGGFAPSESDIDAIRQEELYGGNIIQERALKLVKTIK